MKIYALSGLGADERVFQYLTLNHEVIPIDWIEPFKNEALKDYVLRLSSVIDTTQEFCLLGVSFGGIVAIELHKIVNPIHTIIISSAQTKKQLGGVIGFLSNVNVVRYLPTWIFNIPKPLAHFLFGAKNTKLLNEILNDTDLSFARWAIDQIVRWKNTDIHLNVTKIGGANDKLIPPIKGSNSLIVARGTHFMIVDKAAEVSALINKVIRLSNLSCRVL